MWVLKSPKADPRNYGQYIGFHMLGNRTDGFYSGWAYEGLNTALTFDTRKRAEEAILDWRDSKQPLPDDVIAVEVQHKASEHGLHSMVEI